MWREKVRALSVWLSVVCMSCMCMADAWASHRINEVIGDESWVAAHGEVPGEEVGEVERIRTHLRHVISRLERDAGMVAEVAEVSEVDETSDE